MPRRRPSAAVTKSEVMRWSSIFLSAAGASSSPAIVLGSGFMHSPAVSASGEAFKSFHVRDGLAVKLARAAGLSVGILSARASAIVAARAADLGVDEVLQGHEDKGAAFRELLERRGLEPAAVAFVGDDLQDLPVLGAVGLSAAPSDAAAEVRAAVDFVTAAGGGRGAVRELVERLLSARGEWERVLAGYGSGRPGHGRS